MIDVLMKYKVPSISKLCHGGDPNYPNEDAPTHYLSELSGCDGCHVIIPEQWYKKMYVSYIERGQLAAMRLPTSEKYFLLIYLKKCSFFMLY